MFNYWRHNSTGVVSARVRVDFLLSADNVEFIVAKARHEITSKKLLAAEIKRHLQINGDDYNKDLLSDDLDIVDEMLKDARAIVKKLMPELYRRKT